MRKVLVAIIAVALVGLGFGVGSAGASVRSVDEEAFCETLNGVSDFSENTFDPNSYESITGPMREAAKFAPKKVKKAMRRLAKLYDNLSGGNEEDAAELFSNQRFLKAQITYSTYYAETCADIDIPDV
jgi:hypothetical protein